MLFFVGGVKPFDEVVCLLFRLRCCCHFQEIRLTHLHTKTFANNNQNTSNVMVSLLKGIFSQEELVDAQ